MSILVAALGLVLIFTLVTAQRLLGAAFSTKPEVHAADDHRWTLRSRTPDGGEPPSSEAPNTRFSESASGYRPAAAVVHESPVPRSRVNEDEPTPNTPQSQRPWGIRTADDIAERNSDWLCRDKRYRSRNFPTSVSLKPQAEALYVLSGDEERWHRFHPPPHFHADAKHPDAANHTPAKVADSMSVPPQIGEKEFSEEDRKSQHIGPDHGGAFDPEFRLAHRVLAPFMKHDGITAASANPRANRLPLPLSSDPDMLTFMDAKPGGKKQGRPWDTGAPRVILGHAAAWRRIARECSADGWCLASEDDAQWPLDRQIPALPRNASFVTFFRTGLVTDNPKPGMPKHLYRTALNRFVTLEDPSFQRYAAGEDRFRAWRAAFLSGVNSELLKKDKDATGVSETLKHSTPAELGHGPPWRQLSGAGIHGGGAHFGGVAYGITRDFARHLLCTLPAQRPADHILYHAAVESYGGAYALADERQETSIDVEWVRRWGTAEATGPSDRSLVPPTAKVYDVAHTKGKSLRAPGSFTSKYGAEARVDRAGVT